MIDFCFTVHYNVGKRGLDQNNKTQEKSFLVFVCFLSIAISMEFGLPYIW